MQDILTAVSTVGFPIVMCLIMFNYMNKQTAIHKEETDKLTEALNNNTQAIIKLQAKLGDPDE